MATPRYDRQLLLLGPLRNTTLSLDQIRQYGRDSYADPNYVSLYGMPPAEWYARGVRILGRTAVECTRDALANAIAEDVVARLSTQPPDRHLLIVDPFAGSANTLFWLQRHLPGSRAIGFELDPNVFSLTQRNLALVDAPIELLNTHFADGLTELSTPPEATVIAFIAPPWGTALSPSEGLDLGRTQPPVAEILDTFLDRLGPHILFAIQVFETIVPSSLDPLRHRFARSDLRTYALNAPGQNHGLLLLSDV